MKWIGAYDGMICEQKKDGVVVRQCRQNWQECKQNDDMNTIDM